MSTCCPCISIPQIAVRLGVQYDYFVMVLILFACVATGFGYPLIFAVIFMLRLKIREQFKIEGDLLSDCLMSFCCGCCSVAQMATHVGSYEDGKLNFDKPTALPGYHIV